MESMSKYRVEYGFGENVQSVSEFQTIDGLDIVEAESAEAAARVAACTDGLENALFRVYEFEMDEYGTYDYHNPQYYDFCDWPVDNGEEDELLLCQGDRIDFLLERMRQQELDNLRKMDEKIRAIQNLQNELDRRTRIEIAAIRLMEQCKFDEAIALLKRI